jgi:hypothetical protein
MRLFSVAVCTGVAVALLAGCSGTGSSPSNSMMPGGASKISQLGHHGTPLMAAIPKFLHVRQQGHIRYMAAPKGLYAQQFLSTTASVQGYTKNNSGNGPPICAIGSGTNVNGFGVDRSGEVIVPAAFNGIQIYTGTGGCGTLSATIPDSFGQAADGAAQNAATGTIIVGHANGTVAACTVSGTGGSCTSLTTLSGFVQVAMDNSGNCWATTTSSGLYYFAGCAGSGTAQSGFNSGGGSGGLDIDNAGNVVSTTQGAPSSVTVYHCASNSCSIVTGPTSLNGTGDAVYCHLGRQNERLACGNASTGAVDVYSYLPSRAPGYMYSFNNGLFASNIVEAAAYSPSSPR